MKSIKRSDIVPLLLNSPARGFIVNRPTPGTGFFHEITTELDRKNITHVTVRGDICPDDFLPIVEQADDNTVIIVDNEHDKNGFFSYPGNGAIVYQVLLGNIKVKLLIVSNEKSKVTPINNRLVHINVGAT